MTSDAIVIAIGSVMVALIGLGGLVLQSQRGFQSASIDTIVKQFEQISREYERVAAERDHWKAECERLESELRHHNVPHKPATGPLGVKA